ncbi:hypothetical protein BGW38_010904, partial [Lunasporangiospora selenospora]
RNPRFRDNRVHALLYFIAPTGHSLREIDIELMKRLSPRINVIPVIGKADSLTPSELADFKKRIMEDIEHYNIPIYNFPYDPEEDDEETVEENSELRSLLPFALVGCEEEITISGRKTRARQYPWGIVEVDNIEHCDFAKLRSALLCSHMQDLKEITHDFLYENYRTEKLSRTAENESESDSVQDEHARLKDEQMKKEKDMLDEIEGRLQRELSVKQQELMAKEQQINQLEAQY